MTGFLVLPLILKNKSSCSYYFDEMFCACTGNAPDRNNKVYTRKHDF